MESQPAKLRQKDRDARWTVKFSKAKEHADGTKPAVDIAVPTFGYQNHIAIDRRLGLIRRWQARCRRLQRGAATPGPARQNQYRQRGLGRHSLPVQSQRGVPRGERVRQPHSSQEAARTADVAHDPASERTQVHGPLTRRARFCGSEGQDRILHPHGRRRPATIKIGMADLVYDMRRLLFLRRLAAT